MIQHSKGKSRLVDIPESMPGVDEVSCVRRRVVPLPSPSVSASDTSRSDTPTYVGDALGTPSTSVTLGGSSVTSLVYIGSRVVSLGNICGVCYVPS
jgi:hypothetical protein